MKIQLKRSNVLETGKAKVPTSAQLDYGELAINYNADDPTLFLKDSNDNVIKFGGTSAYDDRYVQRAGDNMTGDLTFGTDGASTPNITLDADGSASFAGDVQLAGNAKAGEAGIKLEASGLISAARAGTAADGAPLAVFGGYNGGSSTATSSIRNDGSATFAGDVDMAAVNTSTYQTGVRAETNSGNTTLTVYGDSTNDSGAFVVYDGQAADKTKVRINNNGSATFAAPVTVGDNPNVDGDYGVKAEALGKIGVRRAGLTDITFASYPPSGASPSAFILANGSATFAGTVQTTNGGVFINRDLTADDSSLLYCNNTNASNGGIKFSVTRQSVNIGTGITNAFANSNIRLFTNGTATFAGDVKAGDRDPGDTNARGVRLAVDTNNGGCYVQAKGSSTASALTAFQAVHGTDEKFKVSYDGSATFAGIVQIGDNAPTPGESGVKIYPNGNIAISKAASATDKVLNVTDENALSRIAFYSDGSATYTGEVGVANRIYTTGENAKFEVASASTGSSTSAGLEIGDIGGRKAAIFTDGSASFQGDVTAGGYSFANLQEL